MEICRVVKIQRSQKRQLINEGAPKNSVNNKIIIDIKLLSAKKTFYTGIFFVWKQFFI